MAHVDMALELGYTPQPSRYMIGQSAGSYTPAIGELEEGIMDIVLAAGTPHETLRQVHWILTDNPDFRHRPLIGTIPMAQLNASLAFNIGQSCGTLEFTSGFDDDIEQRYQIPMDVSADSCIGNWHAMQRELPSSL
jgi:hypothetical protein